MPPSTHEARSDGQHDRKDMLQHDAASRALHFPTHLRSSCFDSRLRPGGITPVNAGRANEPAPPTAGIGRIVIHAHGSCHELADGAAGAASSSAAAIVIGAPPLLLVPPVGGGRWVWRFFAIVAGTIAGTSARATLATAATVRETQATTGDMRYDTA